jgi:beta-lactamase class A
VTTRHAYVASSPDGTLAAERIVEEWSELAITGQLLARNIDTDEELGFDVDRRVPLASVIKVPLALVVLEAIALGELDPASRMEVDPLSSIGPTGVAAFRFPATIAVADLVLLILAVSDNASADALLDLVGIAAVNDAVQRWGCPGIRLRHSMRRMHQSASDASNGKLSLAMELAIQSDETGQRVIEPLHPDYANIGSAADLVTLLQRIWRDEISDPRATAELRRMMSLQVFTQRLSSELRTDTIRVSGKTGSFLHLRHEIGVVESATGDRVAIAALTRTARPAAIAPDVDLAIGAAARTAFETLRSPSQTGPNPTPERRPMGPSAHGTVI